MKTKKLLEKYSFPCLNEKIREFQGLPNYEKIFKNFKTIEEVRRYFFEYHNKKTIEKGDSFHLAIPYKILEINKEEIIGRVYFLGSQIIKPSQIESKFNLELFPDAKLEGIIIRHLLPVEYLTREEFKKYERFFVL